MKIAGIVAEYNPFHKGHAYHIQETRRRTGADFIIAVMSGDFVQRGGPAFLTKQARTRIALTGGADLIFELPSTHSCQSAELFARSAVQLLMGLGCVDILSFGSESGDLNSFWELGGYLAEEPPAYRKLLREHLKSGLSFPAARSQALASLLPLPEDFISSPNNILGIEYCKALYLLHSSIKPFTVKRAGSGYHDLDMHQEFPSASAIRNAWKSLDGPEFSPHMDNCFPAGASSIFRKAALEEGYLTEEDFSLLLRWLLFQSDASSLSLYPDLSSDLADRMMNTRNRYEDFSQYVSVLKTKELTHTRILRALFHALLDIREVPPLTYARLLGYRRQALPVLSEIKGKGRLPLITKMAGAASLLDAEGRFLLEMNTRISNLYESVCCEKMHRPFIHEFSRPLVILP